MPKRMTEKPSGGGGGYDGWFYPPMATMGGPGGQGKLATRAGQSGR